MIKTYTDLIAWQKSHQLVLRIYSATASFPKNEIFGLTSQVRRAAISVSSNLAEGFTRRFPKEQSQFYAIAMGSLIESHNQLLISKDLGYLSEDQFEELNQKITETRKLIYGLINHLTKY